MGRAGAGKSTQAKLLIDKLKKIDQDRGLMHIETGAEFRKFNEGPSYTARLGKSIVNAGALMPEFMCVYLWSRALEERFTGNEHVIFDGTPRKLLEARMLEQVFPFYKLDKPWVIYLDVDHTESHTRLSLRAKSSGRADDAEDIIKKRQQAYEADVHPTVEWYRSSPDVTFLEIAGERSVEDIHADIVKKLGLS